MYIDKRAIYVIMAIMVLWGLTGLNESRILSLLLTVPGLLIAITFHEFAHALAADKLGDDTPRSQGRLNLNPFSHLDPVGSILLLFAGFGWGKPVQINPRNFDRKVNIETGEAIVSLAGPVMNIVLAILFSVIYAALVRFAPAFLLTQTGVIVATLLTATIATNVGLGVFNLIPLPPLDGSKIFITFMPYNAKRWITEHSQIFHIIFLVIWLTGLAGTIISPAINWLSSGILWLAFKIFGMV